MDLKERLHLKEDENNPPGVLTSRSVPLCYRDGRPRDVLSTLSTLSTPCVASSSRQKETSETKSPVPMRQPPSGWSAKHDKRSPVRRYAAMGRRRSPARRRRVQSRRYTTERVHGNQSHLKPNDIETLLPLPTHIAIKKERDIFVTEKRPHYALSERGTIDRGGQAVNKPPRDDRASRCLRGQPGTWI